MRKLSTQVLNEAQHLGQLSCVLSTLRKFRWRHLSSNQSLDLIKRAHECVQAPTLGGGELINNSESDIDELESLADQATTTTTASNEATRDGEAGQLNYILEVIRDIYIQHKIQISEQMNEVHKLMSISSDDDLLSHLQ